MKTAKVRSILDVRLAGLIAGLALGCGASPTSGAETNAAVDEAEQSLGASPAGDSAVGPEASSTEKTDAEVTRRSATESAPEYGALSAGHLKSSTKN